MPFDFVCFWLQFCLMIKMMTLMWCVHDNDDGDNNESQTLFCPAALHISRFFNTSIAPICMRDHRVHTHIDDDESFESAQFVFVELFLAALHLMKVSNSL